MAAIIHGQRGEADMVYNTRKQRQSFPRRTVSFFAESALMGVSATLPQVRGFTQRASKGKSMKPIPILMTEDEPTDEQLAALMHEVALEAQAKAESANQKLMERIKRETQLALREQKERQQDQTP
jgi:hypothetical protein